MMGVGLVYGMWLRAWEPSPCFFFLLEMNMKF